MHIHIYIFVDVSFVDVCMPTYAVLDGVYEGNGEEVATCDHRKHVA
jgi:hypothetical protein